jgi:hypothetical protein
MPEVESVNFDSVLRVVVLQVLDELFSLQGPSNDLIGSTSPSATSS